MPACQPRSDALHVKLQHVLGKFLLIRLSSCGEVPVGFGDAVSGIAVNWENREILDHTRVLILDRINRL